jgi:hypothetical protein
VKWWRAAVVALAVAAALVPLPAALVERWYSSRFFAFIQPPITAATNLVPIAVFDVVLAALVAVLVLIAVSVARAWSRGRWRAVAQGASAVAVLAAGLFLWFWVVWGLNYRRVPIDERLARVTTTREDDAVLALATRAVSEVNALHPAAHAAGFVDAPERDAKFREAFSATLAALGHTSPVEPGRLKRTILGPYFRWAGVDGMISPFTLEVLGNPDLLPFERPFVSAHEWGHLAGFGDEAEASFVGWVTCMHGGPATRYSGWLFLLWQARAEVTRQARAKLDAALGPGPRADIAAVVARLERGTKPQLQRVSWAAYDQYLKANRVDEGVRSYSRVLELLALTRFDEHWTPLLAETPR